MLQFSLSGRLQHLTRVAIIGRMKLRCAMLIALVLALGTGLFAKDKNGAPENLANMHFTVVKDDNGKPVRNASIVLHPVGKDGDQGKGGYQLKTNGEGEIEDQGVPTARSHTGACARISDVRTGLRHQPGGHGYRYPPQATHGTVQHLRQLRTRYPKKMEARSKEHQCSRRRNSNLLLRLIGFCAVAVMPFCFRRSIPFSAFSA